MTDDHDAKQEGEGVDRKLGVFAALREVDGTHRRLARERKPARTK